MRTDDVVAMLARQGAPAKSAAVGRRFSMALAAGAIGALALLAALLGTRPDLRAAFGDPMFWVKLGYPALLLAAAFATVCLLARPGARSDPRAWLALAPVAGIVLLALVALASAAPDSRTALVFGDTWSDCIVNVAMLALPAFVASLWAMRSLAPTRPRLAGAFCGLFAGATGAVTYTLHCPEMAAPFIAAWYSAGIAVPVVAGALAGPAVLRW
jgi:hypothetical protein